MIWLAESVMQPVSYNRISRILIDNGLLSLQLLDCESILLENQVALSLFRKYGHDEDNERVFFYNANVEVMKYKYKHL